MKELWRTTALGNMRKTLKGIWKVDRARKLSQEKQSSLFTSWLGLVLLLCHARELRTSCCSPRGNRNSASNPSDRTSLEMMRNRPIWVQMKWKQGTGSKALASLWVTPASRVWGWNFLLNLDQIPILFISSPVVPKLYTKVPQSPKDSSPGLWDFHGK